MDEGAWDGQWVSDRLGVRLESTAGQPLPQLVGLALRRNAKRAHLLVSHVLGKHVPLDPGIALAAGAALAEQVRVALAGEPASVVLGYAETATGLGHAVADELGAPVLHSTRRRVPGIEPALAFEEAHSHATEHRLLPADPALLAAPRPVVLVDDELSTGRTALNTIRALHARCPRERYVLATLVDVRGPDDVERLDEFATGLGIRVEVAAAARGRVRLPDDLSERAGELIAGRPAGIGPIRRRADVEVVEPPWPAGLPEGGRHGCPAGWGAALQDAVSAVAAGLAQWVHGSRILVLGCEELMYAPLRIAADLAGQLGPARPVRFSATTRSPVVAIDEPGYPIRTALTFPAHEPGAGGERYAYNVAPPAGAEPFTDIVLVTDTAADTPSLWAGGGLADQLRRAGDRLVVVTLPTHRPNR